MRLFLTSAACPRIPGDREASRPHLDEISRSHSASGHYRDSGAARNRSRTYLRCTRPAGQSGRTSQDRKGDLQSVRIHLTTPARAMRQQGV